MRLLKQRSLSRRTMLRGAVGGTSFVMGLPLLEAMLDRHGEAHADGAALPVRIVTWMTANGVLLDKFEPSTVGASWSLSEQLAPLQSVKPYVNVCTGFKNRGAEGQAVGGHVEGVTAFTGYPYAYSNGGAAFEPGGPSLDQIIADRVADETPVRSLQVGISKANLFSGMGGLGIGISFRGEPGAITALPPVDSPAQVWQSLFGIFPGPGAVDNDRIVRAMMLDAVKAQADTLRGKLGANDQMRVDAHLQGVAELNQKISALAPPCVMPDEPTLTNSEPVGAELIGPVNRAMAELIAYALHCDITRVVSVQFLGLAGETPYTEIGLSATKHLLSHDAQYNVQAREQLHQSVVYEMERFAEFCETLHQSDERNGTNLLDSTICYWSSDLSVGWLHSLNRQPVILVGSGRGHLKNPGVHVQAIANDPDDPNGEETAEMPSAGNISDIALTVLQAFGPITSFGGGSSEASGPLSELMA